MVYMMEKYADNLEELVMDRTGQLIEEQKKTEALLERMLPRFVTNVLFSYCLENWKGETFTFPFKIIHIETFVFNDAMQNLSYKFM